MKKLKLLSFLGLLFFAVTTFAMQPFVIKKISIRGLQGISTTTVFSYLPVKVGDRVDDTMSDRIIASLYKTGFFDNIALENSNGTLIIKVAQRPIIGSLKIKGNSDIPTKKLMESLTSLHFIEGQVYSPSLLNKIKTALQHQYFVLGKYNARIDINITKASRNRVNVVINISEGVAAKIHKIDIIGNHAFSDGTLLREFQLKSTGLFTWIGHTDQYSREKLDADLETLRSYYMDRGYLQFKINSRQISITPDHKQVYVAIDISEGSRYQVSGYSLSGKLILPRAQIEKLILLKKGQIFVRQDVMDTNKRISNALSDKGYANAAVNVVPKINKKDETVFVKFVVVPGRRMYVHHITFSGNVHTNDKTLRRALTQFEGGVLSSKALNDSKRQLLQLPYIQDVQVSTKPVSGSSNEMNVNYQVTEQSAAQLQGGIAYSQLNKFMVTASFTQPNFLGEGKNVSLSAATSSPTTSINFSIYDPYYKKTGIGRNFNIYVTHYNAKKANVTNYALNSYGASFGYSFRLSENNTFQVSAGYDNSYLALASSVSKEVTSFIQKHGRHFEQMLLGAGLVSQTFNRPIFPTEGLYQSANLSVSAPIDSNSLEYYKLGYNATYYHPIYHGFIGKLNGAVNYGNGYGHYDNLPFFKNYYVGGQGTVRGYNDNSIGGYDSQNNPIGGNFSTYGSIGLIVPNPISQRVRTSLFLDGGSVNNGIKLSKARYSAGIEVDWFSPMGMLNFSFAEPFHRHGDDIQQFQFNMGTTF